MSNQSETTQHTEGKTSETLKNLADNVGQNGKEETETAQQKEERERAETLRHLTERSEKWYQEWRASRSGEKSGFHEEALPGQDWGAKDSMVTRLKKSGSGAELARRICAEEVRGGINALLEAGSTVDVLILHNAFELLDHWSGQASRQLDDGQALFVEALLAVLGINADVVLDSGIQRRPWRN